jgi:predicted nucleic acid-binding protein
VIAADTSTWVAYFGAVDGDDVRLLDSALRDRQVLMVPAVLTELLSDPTMPEELAQTISSVPLLPLQTGYWQRAGALRARVLEQGRKARLGDALIAQNCIDNGLPLLTRDRDFRAFAEAAALQLVLGFTSR